MHKAQSFRLLFALFITVGLFTSCVNTKKAVYFNNIQDTVLRNQAFNIEPLIQKSDLLNITVSSLNPEASVIFNTPNLITGMSSLTSGTSGISGVGTPQYLGYLVNTDGVIKFPILGDIKVEGLTQRQVENNIQQELTEKKLLVDPIVNVRFLNFRVTVIGEVSKPTTINVINEKISILEALGLAGDLTVYAKRDNVLLIRENKNEKIIKRIDLNSSNILTSEYYYLKTNDVLYVEARKEKVLSTSRTQQLLPIIISALSFIAIIADHYLR
jgi:polysaccharide export outer membrane protein